MKIISVALFVAALIGSWSLTHSQRPVSESVHVGIQNDLKNIIAEYIEKNAEQSENLRFEKFWTETINKSRVKAYFLYSYDDHDENGEPATIEVEGWAILNKVDETPETVTWSFDQLNILNNQVTFSDPIKITAGTGELEGGTPTESENEIEH
ncbi:MAG: hypothetical protein AB7F86_07950 [Bdellovibrionales bacterium]